MVKILLSSLLGVAFLVFVSLYGIVLLQEGVRIIPLISSKQLNQSSLQDSTTDNNYIPLRFNQAGVMPIILTTAILVVPNYISNLGLLPTINSSRFLESSKFIYWISYFTY
jgi:preprotein translocase subunit SecY